MHCKVWDDLYKQIYVTINNYKSESTDRNPESYHRLPSPQGRRRCHDTALLACLQDTALWATLVHGMRRETPSSKGESKIGRSA